MIALSRDLPADLNYCELFRHIPFVAINSQILFSHVSVFDKGVTSES